MIDVSLNTIRTKELLQQDRNWEKECREEYEEHSKIKKERGMRLFYIWQGHFNEIAGIMIVKWSELPCQNKVVWIRTAEDVRAKA